ESILNYVRRSQEQVLLADVADGHAFAQDAYLLRARPKSALCVPIVLQTKLIGMLYLEHREATGVFTPERLELLRLLAAQAAISIENARLYDEAQQREIRLRRLVESNLIGIVFSDTSGRITDANDAYLKIIGYTRAELIAGKIDWT